MGKFRYQWAAPGDVNAFFGLMLDNIAGLVLTVTMLHSIFQFPVDFILRYMIPGTAIGVLVGDLIYFWLAFRLAEKEQRSDVCAMPLGLDTPSTIGMVLFVLGPAFTQAKESNKVWLGVHRLSSRMTVPELSRTLATRGIWPGRLCVAQA